MNRSDLETAINGYMYIIERLERFMNLRPLAIVEVNIAGNTLNVYYETWLDGKSTEHYESKSVEEFLQFLNQ